MHWSIYSIVLGLTLIYLYLTRKFNYWSKRGVKGPKPLPGLGNLLEFFVTPQVVLEVDFLKKFGKIYGYYIGNKPVLTVAEPELIKAILVKDFHLFVDRRPNSDFHPITSKIMINLTGDDWKRIRSIASPTFTSGKMKKMYPLIEECIKNFVSHLDGFAKDMSDINAKDMFGNLTMDVIATCAFATKINSNKQLDCPFVLHARKSLNFQFSRILLALILPNFIAKLIGFYPTFTAETRDFFLSSLRNILSERRKSNQKFNDFVQLLFDAGNVPVHFGDDNETYESHHINEGIEEKEIQNKIFDINLKDKHLSESELIAQCYVILLAGYETTATTLTFCSYELATNPEVQQKLVNELNSAVDSNGQIVYEELTRLPYLDAVISETLRLHSPILRSVRTASADYKLGDTGITIEKGQLIEIPVYGIHLLEEFYPEPLKFDPDRFLAANKHLIKPYTYLPFSSGPRSCIGMRFALLEIKLCLAHIIQKYQFTKSPQTQIPVRPKRQLTLNSPESVIIGIQYRHNK